MLWYEPAFPDRRSLLCRRLLRNLHRQNLHRQNPSRIRNLHLSRNRNLHLQLPSRSLLLQLLSLHRLRSLHSPATRMFSQPSTA